MAYKEFEINDHKVKIYKRKKAKYLRITIDSNGFVKISIPFWAPYKSGLDFYKSRIDWINKNQSMLTKPVLEPNQIIGKAHRLVFQAGEIEQTLNYSIRSNLVIVKHPKTTPYLSNEVQSKAEKASIEALRLQANELLPKRLEELSKRTELSFSSIQIKKMKTRWGSCDSNKKIVLNLYLMLLPWRLIDYVLYHELTHTKVLRHGPKFWQEIAIYCPNYKELKKELRNYQTRVGS
jgi:predicted metal-dependent hydrolase